MCIMELIWLEDFLALASLRNFSRAAEARHITQPAFSRRIRALELELGVSLFDRAATGVDLTAAGETLRPGAEEIVRRVRQVTQEVRATRLRAEATLSFAATHALSFTFFPGWMRDLEREQPLGPLRLVSDSMQGCENLMLQGQVEFLLCHHRAAAPARFDPSQLISLRVGEDRLEPYSAPTADGAPLWPLSDRPTGTPYLAYNPESGLGRILEATVFSDGRAAGLETVFTSHLAATLLSMARDGRGVCWLPRALVEDDLAMGRLVPASDCGRVVDAAGHPPVPPGGPPEPSGGDLLERGSGPLRGNGAPPA
jgi:DNA-binding transcriptional LysR family regulator